MFDDFSFTRCSGTNDPNNAPSGKPLDSNWGSWPDGDNDGLPDKWETDGVWVEGKFLDLPAEGVSVRQPDLFVYADAEAGWGLNDAVFSYLQSAFATSPLLVKVHVI